MIKPPFSNKKELFVWGPIPLRNFYASPYNVLFSKGAFTRVFEKKYAWPVSVVMYRNGRCGWINDFAELRKTGARVFRDFLLPSEKRATIRSQYEAAVDSIEAIEKEIDTAHLSLLSDAEFLALWKRFFDAILEMWVYGILPELANYGGEKLLEKELKNQLQNEKEVSYALQVLTAPEELSFYQQEEIALAKTTDLDAHARRYEWIKNSYFGPVPLSAAFFRERKKTMDPCTGPELHAHLSVARKKKEALQKKLGISNESMSMAHALSYSISWQDHRKSVIFQYLSFMEKLLDEMLRRKKWDKEEALTLTVSELRDWFKGKKDFSSEAKQRLKGFTALINEKQVFLHEKETLELWNYYLEKPATRDGFSREIKGITASIGAPSVVTGKVRILLDPYNLKKMQKGEILVVPMTSPEYVFAMKKAAAIVTDTGGLTSHAAIVSRELKKSCIVGTKIATKVFKDGDFVEVDANHGTVKILEKSERN